MNLTNELSLAPAPHDPKVVPQQWIFSPECPAYVILNPEAAVMDLDLQKALRFSLLIVFGNTKTPTVVTNMNSNGPGRDITVERFRNPDRSLDAKKEEQLKTILKAAFPQVSFRAIAEDRLLADLRYKIDWEALPLLAQTVSQPKHNADPDVVNGMWWNPKKGGLGYGFELCDSTLFVAMYTYGADGAPTHHEAWLECVQAFSGGSKWRGVLQQFRIRPSWADDEIGEIEVLFDDGYARAYITVGGTIRPLIKYTFGPELVKKNRSSHTGIDG